MMKRFLILSTIIFLMTGFVVGSVKAVTEGECQDKEAAEDWDGAEKCWNEYFGAKKSTLKNEIESKSIQIDLTARKISSTQERLKIWKQKSVN